jgi:hypothetical protein
LASFCPCHASSPDHELLQQLLGLGITSRRVAASSPSIFSTSFVLGFFYMNSFGWDGPEMLVYSVILSLLALFPQAHGVKCVMYLTG